MLFLGPRRSKKEFGHNISEELPPINTETPAQEGKEFGHYFAKIVPYKCRNFNLVKPNEIMIHKIGHYLCNLIKKR